jgi:hypothetical protein
MSTSTESGAAGIKEAHGHYVDGKTRRAGRARVARAACPHHKRVHSQREAVAVHALRSLCVRPRVAHVLQHSVRSIDGSGDLGAGPRQRGHPHAASDAL